jgi:hypothetical protein
LDEKVRKFFLSCQLSDEKEERDDDDGKNSKGLIKG